MPATSTRNSWLFPPSTREVQFDEKWSFVAKKEKNCDDTNPADDRKGDTWDHVAIDAESRLIVSVVPGERTAENVVTVVEDFKRRTGGRLMDLITTDGYPAYEDAILEAYGETITPPRTGKRGRPKAPFKVAPKNLIYAVVEKTREKGRVVSIATRVVFGTKAAVVAALEALDATAIPPRHHILIRSSNSALLRHSFRYDYVTPSIGEIAALLARDPLSIGFDYYSLDPADSTTYPCHMAVGRAGIPAFVCLDLGGVEPGDYWFTALPLPVADLEGCPVRAILAQ